LTILPVLIELALISLAPIFLTAAKAVAPPRIRKTARDDITFAYVSRLRICFKSLSLIAGGGTRTSLLTQLQPTKTGGQRSHFRENRQRFGHGWETHGIRALSGLRSLDYVRDAGPGEWLIGAYGEAESVVSLNLPAGNFFVVAETEFINTDISEDHNAVCRLNSGGTEIAEQSATALQGLLFPSGGVTAAGITVGGGRVELSCGREPLTKCPPSREDRLHEGCYGRLVRTTT
jgi:hypothetical protein